jgi:predicted metal-dependent enzyme (double-stranded beta helix superfamily)
MPDEPRVLSRREMSLVLDRVAAQPGFADHIRFDPDDRVAELVYRDASCEVYLICWLTGQDTGFHDHDGSSALINVLQGAVREQRITDDGSPTEGVRYEVGAQVGCAPEDIHRMTNPWDSPAVTLHAYSPPLRSMGSYSRAEDGKLLRAELSPDVKLSPVDGSFD